MPSSFDRSGPIWFIRTVPTNGGTGVDVTDKVFQLTYEDDEKKADKLTLNVDNYDLANLDSPLFAKGVVLEVQWGYPGNMSPAREVVIQTVKGGQLLTVEALDKGILMNKVKLSRTFERVTRSDVVKRIAKEEGYDATHVEETTHVYDHIVQPRLTNAEMLKEMAKKEGFEFFVDFDGMHWHRKNLGQAPARELVWFNDRRGTLKDFSIANDVTAKPAAIVTKGRDPIKKEDFVVTADDATTKRTGAPIIEAIDPRTETTFDKVGAAAGTATLAPTTEPNAEAAKREADGQFRQAQITLVELENCKCVGDPSFLAKTICRISGIRSLSGNYYVTTVKHTLNASGYEIEFKCKRDGRDHTLEDTKAVQSKAQPNDQPAKKDDELDPVETIQARTETTIWSDSRGRQSLG